jgi:hypothetical protein
MTSTIPRWIRSPNVWVLNRHPRGTGGLSTKRMKNMKPKIPQQLTERYAQPFGYFNDVNPL